MSFLSGLMPSSTLNSQIINGFLLGKVNTQGRDLGWYDFVLDRSTFYWAQAIKQSGPIPQHMAFCMDGNRRFARKKQLAAGEGHIAGFEAMMRVLNGCYHLGVNTVTVYAFSIENFNRSPEESEVLFNLVRTKLWDTLIDGKSATSQLNWKIKFLGRRELLDDNLKERIDSIESMTKDCTGMVVNICAPYTSRDDMAHAIATTAQSAADSVNGTKSDTTNSSNSSTTNGSTDNSNNGDKSTTNSNTNKDSNGSKASVSSSSDNDKTTNNGSSNSDTGASSGKKSNSGTNNGSDDSKSNSSNKNSSSSTGSQKSGSQSPSSPDSSKVNPSLITLNSLKQNRYMSESEQLDILVRTSGETRFSDFMTYECDDDCMYEIVPVLWPELSLRHLVRIIYKWQTNQTSQKQTVKVSSLRNGPPTISVSKKK